MNSDGGDGDCADGAQVDHGGGYADDGGVDNNSHYFPPYFPVIIHTSPVGLRLLPCGQQPLALSIFFGGEVVRLCSLGSFLESGSDSPGMTVCWVSESDQTWLVLR